MRKFLLFLPFVLMGCREQDTIGYSFNIVEHLNFKEIEYPEILGNTMQLNHKDSFLLLNDFYGDSLIHMYNLNTQKIEKKLFAKGDGPNDMIPPLEVQKYNNQLFFFSRPLHVLEYQNWSDLNKQTTLKERRQIDGRADCFIPLSENKLVFSGFWDNRYALFDLNTSELKEFGAYPNYWEEESRIPALAKAMFHQCRFAVNEKRNKFASCSYFVLEIFEYTPTLSDIPKLCFRKQLDKYEYDYKTGDRISAKMRKETSGLASVDAVSGENYLYILIQDSNNKRNRNIMILDWNGNPIKLLKSNKRIICFDIDEINGKGYAIINDPEDKLVMFDLNL